MKLVVIGLLCVWATAVVAQQTDTTRKASQNLLLLPKDTSSANLEEKYILSELQKVQYAKYSENLKEETLRKIVENQKLKTAGLEQRLLTEQLKAEAQRKQAEAAHKQEEARRKQERQKQQIKQLEISQLNQKVILQNRTRNSLFVGVALLSLLGLSLFWSNRQLKKRNQFIQTLSAEKLLNEQEKQQLLATQNETLEQQVIERTVELETSLTNLKITQNQLIQKEKLASLGELTAGIAHEIQNPLNFVNNFAEVSQELVQELLDEENKPVAEQDTVLRHDLLNDLAQNRQKINHHGKRASAIVMGMLEHSRTVSDERVPTDLNKLADEYLRLSYQGMRAKNKDSATARFRADYELITDDTLPLVTVVPQNIGRVLLNLINNAFYACGTDGAGSTNARLPTVKVSLQHANKQVVIQVVDNGPGIPDAIKNKIFQPFFTTKPTGEGTGLGLSLSYDIITKEHNGTIEVNSVAGQGTTFTVCLPV